MLSGKRRRSFISDGEEGRESEREGGGVEKLRTLPTLEQFSGCATVFRRQTFRRHLQ